MYMELLYMFEISEILISTSNIKRWTKVQDVFK